MVVLDLMATGAKPDRGAPGTTPSATEIGILVKLVFFLIHIFDTYPTYFPTSLA